MDHATDRDLQQIVGLLNAGGPEGSITLRFSLAAALVDEIAKHRARSASAERTAEQHSIEVGTLLSSRTKTGIVELIVEGHAVHLDLVKAREVALNLLGAIEAATSDQIVWSLLTGKIGLADDAAARVLLDLRELRQGSRSTVFLQ